MGRVGRLSGVKSPRPPPHLACYGILFTTLFPYFLPFYIYVSVVIVFALALSFLYVSSSNLYLRMLAFVFVFIYVFVYHVQLNFSMVVFDFAFEFIFVYVLYLYNNLLVLSMYLHLYSSNYLQVSLLYLLPSSLRLSPILAEKLQEVPSQVFLSNELDVMAQRKILFCRNPYFE